MPHLPSIVHIVSGLWMMMHRCTESCWTVARPFSHPFLHMRPWTHHDIFALETNSTLLHPICRCQVCVSS